ncbi:hypothetical protein INS49_007709 [Diaporthe citri]|uniref:uncharacterized protein n=1 Tax=Diaporthe citri TaxID=83186 RepID=UPI001C7EC139|nr:uncharacterized protein INS49_007709 [Diaporthe citri]KAG6362617.1 hypothetical protein INS49_007709 [Diaporthe citri]
MFPHSIQTVYNSSKQSLDATLEDYIIEQVDVDPEFPSNFFDGLAVDESTTLGAAPMKVPGASHARITEFQSSMLWGGITHSDAEDLQAEQPVPGLPTVHWLALDNDTLGVKQLIIEFDTEVIVGDAPPRWTTSVIYGGANEYVAAGAQLIVPEMAAGYWSSIPGAQLVTFNDTHPYVHADSRTQAWFLWQPQAALGRLARGRVRGGRVAGRHARRAVRPGSDEALAGPACAGQVDDGCRCSANSWSVEDWRFGAAM